MFTIAEILNTAKAELISGDRERVVSGISIDSRTIKPGEIFIAVKGARFDGHDFINEAADKGAAAIITQREPRCHSERTPVILSKAKNLGTHVILSKAKNPGDSSAFGLRMTREGCHSERSEESPQDVILSEAKNLKKTEPRVYLRVSDTVKALGDIARHHRLRFAIPVIAVTGTSGKTTTKELIAFLLGHKFRVLKNTGTENNFFGVPLTLLRLTKEHDMAVIELGTSKRGEIKRLAEITAPSIGVITNIGMAHLSGLGSLKAVVEEKRALFACLGGKGTRILNADDPNLDSTSEVERGGTTFGIDKPADFMAANIEYGRGGLHFLLNNKYKIELPLLGRHNVYNALAAIALSRQFSLDYETIKDLLKRFKAPSMRMELRKAGDIEIINDAYNSNPLSMDSAIRTLAEYKTNGRRIMVSGDMLELGEDTRKFHCHIGRSIARSGINMLVTVGPFSRDTAREAVRAGMGRDAVRSCAREKEAVSILKQIIRPRDVILVKGSRAMRMENVVRAIMVRNRRLPPPRW